MTIGNTRNNFIPYRPPQRQNSPERQGSVSTSGSTNAPQIHGTAPGNIASSTSGLTPKKIVWNPETLNHPVFKDPDTQRKLKSDLQEMNQFLNSRGYNMRERFDAFGIDYTTLSRFEDGSNVRVDTLAKMATNWNRFYEQNKNDSKFCQIVNATHSPHGAPSNLTHNTHQSSSNTPQSSGPVPLLNSNYYSMPERPRFRSILGRPPGTIIYDSGERWSNIPTPGNRTQPPPSNSGTEPERPASP